MPLISKATAARIWTAHHQIELADKLLEDIRISIEKGGSPTPTDPVDRRQRGYTLGVPVTMGERLFDVAPALAGEVVRAHQAAQRIELWTACVQAFREMESFTDGTESDEVPPHDR